MAKKGSSKGKGKGKDPKATDKVASEATAQQLNFTPQAAGFNARTIANPGSFTTGTTLGQAREILPTMMGQNERAEAATIAPVERVGPINIGPAREIGLGGEYRAGQLGLADTLNKTVRGETPSLAALQYQQAREQALKNSMGMLAAQRGLSRGLATRLYAGQAGDAIQQSAMQAAQTRLAEQIQARQELANLYSTGRTQDFAVQQADQNAFNANAQADAEMRARLGLANQLAANTQNYNQAQLAQNAGQFNSNQTFQRNLTDTTNTQNAALANQGAFNANNIAQGNIAGGIQESAQQAAATKAAAASAAAGQVAAANIGANASIFNNTQDNATTLTVNGIGSQTTTNSDKRVKENVKSGKEATYEMLDGLVSALWNYKNKKMGDGKQLGVMAQDLEKSQLGDQMVEESKDGKKINFAKGFAAILAANADLHRRLKAVEARA